MELPQEKSYANIILVGVMGSGKSAVGPLLAHMLGFGFLDTDAEVERMTRKPVARIFMEQGEAGFRDLERKVVARVANARRHVIATGGGSVGDEGSWQELTKHGLVVWLNPPVDEIVRRMAPGPKALQGLIRRPFLDDLADISGLPPGTKGPALQQFMEEKRKRLADRIKALLGQRLERYRQASIVVEPEFELPETTARNIAAQFALLES